MSCSTVARVRGLRARRPGHEPGPGLLGLGECRGPAGHDLGEVVPLAGERIDARVDPHPQRAAGERLDLAALAFP